MSAKLFLDLDIPIVSLNKLLVVPLPWCSISYHHLIEITKLVLTIDVKVNWKRLPPKYSECLHITCYCCHHVMTDRIFLSGPLSYNKLLHDYRLDLVSYYHHYTPVIQFFWLLTHQNVVSFLSLIDTICAVIYLSGNQRAPLLVTRLRTMYLRILTI